ncbi:hypothetical protein [Faecalibaculum rodentium]|jgi:hypothetical protein|uniref:hypothetical protein n=1 Tax=Faecalibaculum rodentium TaxID=1702221 RepID=UPI00272B22B6|nr:hypothetical protein [Faecalibaculum rodentium]
MNSYKVTYLLNGEEHYDHITERTEKAAQKRLKGIYKDAEITDTELTSTLATATKEQERETLEKIKAMIAELGPQSYLAAAFDGCFEDAEQNIEDDAAYSMKARLEIQAQQAAERAYEIDRLKADLAAAQSKVDTLQSQFDFASQHIKKLERQQLPTWLHGSIYSLVAEEVGIAQKQMEQSAETMAHYADTPQDIAFVNAVKSYRAVKEHRGVCEQIIAGLEALTEE